MLLVGRAMPEAEHHILTADKSVLLIYPGLLARYDQMSVLERLREKIGRRDGIPGLWILIPADEQQTLPVMDGKPVPVISPAQRARIPESWLQNAHRASCQLSVVSGQ